MKKILLLVLFVITLFGCDKNEGFLGGSNSTNKEGIVNSHKVIEIDECEYIVYDASRGYSGYGYGMHKGNCKNPIHECN